eukprot:NODE_291_length_10603_cov_1.029703.p4 type:complete len:340 gc:universal NODE_291_length_10603_cov_1.029703:419-1438(+)
MPPFPSEIVSKIIIHTGIVKTTSKEITKDCIRNYYRSFEFPGFTTNIGTFYDYSRYVKIIYLLLDELSFNEKNEFLALRFSQLEQVDIFQIKPEHNDFIVDFLIKSKNITRLNYYGPCTHLILESLHLLTNLTEVELSYFSKELKTLNCLPNVRNLPLNTSNCDEAILFDVSHTFTLHYITSLHLFQFNCLQLNYILRFFPILISLQHLCHNESRELEHFVLPEGIQELDVCCNFNIPSHTKYLISRFHNNKLTIPPISKWLKFVCLDLQECVDTSVWTKCIRFCNHSSFECVININLKKSQICNKFYCGYILNSNKFKRQVQNLYFYGDFCDKFEKLV